MHGSPDGSLVFSKWSDERTDGLEDGAVLYSRW